MWRIRLNETKSVHVDFTNKRQNYNPVFINNTAIPHENKINIGYRFIPNATEEEIEAAIQRVARAGELAERLTPYDHETAVAFLDVRMYGQKITDRYRAQCATILSQEMDRQGIFDMKRRKTIVVDAIEAHIRNRIAAEPRWRYDDIDAINKFNGTIEGTVERTHPFWYWKTQRAQLAGSLNTLGPWHDDSSFKLSHIVAPVMTAVGVSIGVAAVGWGIYQMVKRLTSPACCGQISCSIIPNTAILHSLPTPSDTGHNAPQTISQLLSKIVTATSENSSAIRDLTQGQNTLTLLTTRLLENYTEKQATGWTSVILSWLPSLPSPR